VHLRRLYLMKTTDLNFGTSLAKWALMGIYGPVENRIYEKTSCNAFCCKCSRVKFL
jgi:hypothetical protein